MDNNEHIIRELTLIGKSPAEINAYMKILEAVAPVVTEVNPLDNVMGDIRLLFRGDTLSPITDDPAEWDVLSDTLWVNNRDPKYISRDSGKTYIWADPDRPGNDTMKAGSGVRHDGLDDEAGDDDDAEVSEGDDEAGDADE